MAENSWKPGDHTNDILRKILNLTEAGGGGGGGGGGLTDAELRATPVDVTVTNPGGGAVTVADGADVAQGAKADATADASTIAGTPTTAATLVSLLKGILVPTGERADSAITNPATDTTVIAALKGILTRLDVALSSVSNPNVGGFSTSIKDTTAISASPDYSIGDAVGGKRTMSNAYRTSGGTAILEDIILLDRANQGPGLTIYLFDSDPSAATITDNSGFVFSTDDLKVIAQISVAASDWVTTNSKKVAHLRGLGTLLKGSGTTSLYAAVVATTAYNAAATDDLQIIYKLLQD